ncbi:MAG: YncE family protein [Bacteroidetes bacterium]|nr:YncE family protein [Bacteroidota bacterium]
MDDDSMHVRLQINDKSKGVFIINEGNFMYGNASLSYYNIETKKVLNDVFYETNDLPLGDVAQSMTINDSLGYIVVNNSGKIYVININTYKYVGKITDLISPRYIHFVNDNKAYITDLYSKKITIIDPQSCFIIGNINVDNSESKFLQHPTEQMLQYKNFLFVSCWSYDNKILVIDTDIDEVIDSIEVAKQPNSMVIDKNNKLWILSDGGFADSPYGQDTAAITKINADNFEVEKIYKFPTLNSSPTKLQINGAKDTLSFIYGNWGNGNIDDGGIYQMPINDDTLPKTPFIEQKTRLFYGLAIDPNNSDIYISDAIDNNQNGCVFRYNAKGFPIDTFKVGIVPGAFCFK